MSYTILVAVDGTPAAGRALDFVRKYSGDRSQLHVVCANVQTRPLAVWPEASLDVRSIEEALLASGRDVADQSAASLRASGLSADSAVRLGFPADAIVREAQSSKAEIIIMGTRGHGVLGGFALGSVAMRVVPASSVPVFLLRPESRLPAQLGRKLRVMLAQDGSEPALRAASALASLRWWLGELDVQIVYVQRPLTYLETVLPPHDDVIRRWSTEAGERGREFCQQDRDTREAQDAMRRRSEKRVEQRVFPVCANDQEVRVHSQGACCDLGEGLAFGDMRVGADAGIGANALGLLAQLSHGCFTEIRSSSLSAKSTWFHESDTKGCGIT